MRTSIGLLLPLALLLACSQRERLAVLKVDLRTMGGPEAKASVRVPGDWYASSSKKDRVEYLGPDSFSKIVFSAAPVAAPESNCPALAHRAAADEAGALIKGTDQEPVLASAGGTVDFKVTVPKASTGTVD